MERGATDALALRYIREASVSGDGLRPTELATRLGISSASATALVDRLVQSGAVLREPHPTDRRSRIIKYTGQHENDDLSALDDARQPLASVIDALNPEELTIIKDFIDKMREAMHDVAKD
jgi:DNA-binding MarR family transcriptional regulator